MHFFFYFIDPKTGKLFSVSVCLCLAQGHINAHAHAHASPVGESNRRTSDHKRLPPFFLQLFFCPLAKFIATLDPRPFQNAYTGCTDLIIQWSQWCFVTVTPGLGVIWSWLQFRSFRFSSFSVQRLVQDVFAWCMDWMWGGWREASQASCLTANYASRFPNTSRVVLITCCVFLAGHQALIRLQDSSGFVENWMCESNWFYLLPNVEAQVAEEGYIFCKIALIKASWGSNCVQLTDISEEGQGLYL